jgi:hypothetical protein
VLRMRVRTFCVITALIHVSCYFIKCHTKYLASLVAVFLTRLRCEQKLSVPHMQSVCTAVTHHPCSGDACPTCVLCGERRRVGAVMGLPWCQAFAGHICFTQSQRCMHVQAPEVARSATIQPVGRSKQVLESMYRFCLHVPTATCVCVLVSSLTGAACERVRGTSAQQETANGAVRLATVL